MRYLAYLVHSGVSVRQLEGFFDDPFEGLRVAREKALAGEGVSVNREDVPQPSNRAGEVLAGVGEPMTREENSKKSNASRAAELAHGRWVRKQRKLGHDVGSN